MALSMQSISTSCCSLFSCLDFSESTESLELKTVTPAVEEIVTTLTDASRSVPDARLIIASSCCPESTSTDSSIVRLPPTADGKPMFGVIQRLQDVEFTIKLSFKKPSWQLPMERQYQIFYDPASDNCLFVDEADANNEEVVNNERPMIFLTSLSASTNRSRLCNNGATRTIQPGTWRISAVCSGGDTDEHHLFEFLLLARKFSVSLYKPPPAKQTANGDEPLRKRQRLDDNAAEATVAESATTLTGESAAIVSCNDPASEYLYLRDIIDKDAIPVLELVDGETAVIQATTREAAGNYLIRRIRYIYRTNCTSVFICQHSAVPEEDVAAKILHYSTRARDYALRSIANTWKCEKNMLEKLKHRNIMSLKAFDGRIFSLYFELLPPSLFTEWKSTLKLRHAHRILKDMASALEYLADQRVVHNDIKPCNVAYSPDRGAVLLDFGLATSIGEMALGGTPWYLPPDIFEEGDRDLPGDVWALAVTMLYVLQRITLPNYPLIGLRLRDLCKTYEEVKRVKEWLEVIAGARAALDQTNEFESIIFKMLETKGELRIKAADIVSALGGLDMNANAA